ncbi:MAG TPA: FAD-dependent oxidoreductase [Candidatus Binatia bacterium]|nr:FAD-dependent oxidoreductase [Candidatus Binatia bacterium]
MPRERLVVIGGDAAGMSAASQARRRRPDLDIVAFERSPHTSYSACGIPYHVGGIVDDADALIARTPETFRDKLNIDARILHEAMEIDLARRRVCVRGLETGRVQWEPFDQLVIATGALPVWPEVPGGKARGIHAPSTLQSGIAIRQAIDQDRPRRAVIVGGGYVGLEMAEALVSRGLEVSLIDRGRQVMGTLDVDMGELVSGALRAAGVSVHLEESLESFEVAGERVKAVVTDRRTLPADVVILGMGVEPNTALAAAAGIPLGEAGAISVDGRMRTPIEGIWAAGDCVESFHLVSRRPFYVALGTVANKQGRVAGINIGGGDATFPGVVGTAASKICAVEVARTGLQEEEIHPLGWEYVSATIRSHTRAGYYPGAGPITVKVVAERASGRLLGGQIVGIEGAAKRIDVLATALHAGLTVHEMIHLDLSYAPPYSPVWDPVLIAARKAADLL